MDRDVRQICEEEICKLLADHARSPLKNTREEDFRATLVAGLRSRFKKPVSAIIELKSCGQAEQLLQDKKLNSIKDKTSRVHAEVKLGGDEEKGNEKARFDIVVLREAQVRLVAKRGLTDVQATLQLEDVAAVIELKAAPLSSSSTKKGIRNDLERLAGLRSNNSELLRFLVVVDKSLSLGLIDDYEQDAERVRKLKDFIRNKDCRRHVGNVGVWYLDIVKREPRPFAPRRFSVSAA